MSKVVKKAVAAVKSVVAPEKKREETKAPVKAEAPKDNKPRDPKGSRSILLPTDTNNKAFAVIDKKVFKIKRHQKRRAEEWLIAPINGGKSVKEKDWLAGRADLGLT